MMNQAELFKQRCKLMNVLFQVKQVITYQLIGVLSKVMQVKNNSQRKLLYDFFQAEEQRRQKEEALNRAKTEINEALTVYYKLESDLSGYTRPKYQLNIDDDRIERLRKIKEKLLENAQANFIESADAYASNVKQLGREILQKIEDYRQAKSDASSSIQETRSEWQSLQNRENVRYVQSELSTVQNQLNLAEQHFQADTISDYRQTLEISRQVSSEISELTRLLEQRKSERQKRISARNKGIGLGFVLAIPGFILGFIAGLFPGCIVWIATKSEEAGEHVIGGVSIAGAIIGFFVGFAKGWKKRKG
jgi:hypothetical protein